MTYSEGHVKRNPGTGEVALRTHFPEGINDQLDGMAWVVSTTQRGPRNTSTVEVEAWTDLFTPEVSE